MSILPLPVFEADADPRHRAVESDEEIYRRLRPPETVVVRFGAMKLVGEYPYDGSVRPGCGSKLVARTHRGTEIVEMLTTTCGNAGCSKSVTRQEMLDYIDNSGGRDFPFYTEGRVLHVATIEEMNKQSELNARKPEYVKACKAFIEELELPMKLVEVEPILGEELLTFYYMSQARVDFRSLVRRLAAEFKARIEMRQVGARDEARLVADFERCGQHCCCKNFLKVLKPVSMKSAKLQKATLDPLKISGRCGRLMCCLRYEDQTYDQLKKNLPHRGSRVGTPEGPGTVVDTKILVQLVLVRLDHDQQEVALSVEELVDPRECPQPEAAPAPAPTPQGIRGSRRPPGTQPRVTRPTPGERPRPRGRDADQPAAPPPVEPSRGEAPPASKEAAGPSDRPQQQGRKRRRRRRRRDRRGGEPKGE
jgi:cell fate regulator YaaT (PSP1 superfamily)